MVWIICLLETICMQKLFMQWSFEGLVSVSEILMLPPEMRSVLAVTWLNVDGFDDLLKIPWYFIAVFSANRHCIQLKTFTCGICSICLLNCACNLVICWQNPVYNPSFVTYWQEFVLWVKFNLLTPYRTTPRLSCRHNPPAYCIVGTSGYRVLTHMRSSAHHTLLTIRMYY